MEEGLSARASGYLLLRLVLDTSVMKEVSQPSSSLPRELVPSHRQRRWSVFAVVLLTAWYLIGQAPALYWTALWHREEMLHPYTYTLSQQLEGWYNRTTPADSDTFEPSVADLHLVVLSTSMVRPEGFNVAVFQGGLVVDADGNVARMNETDYGLLQELSTLR